MYKRWGSAEYYMRGEPVCIARWDLRETFPTLNYICELGLFESTALNALRVRSKNVGRERWFERVELTADEGCGRRTIFSNMNFRLNARRFNLSIPWKYVIYISHGDKF